jgi:hypothetical protein
MRAIVSTTAFISICRIIEEIYGKGPQNILFELIGLVFFAIFMEWISDKRIVSILQR